MKVNAARMLACLGLLVVGLGWAAGASKGDLNDDGTVDTDDGMMLALFLAGDLDALANPGDMDGDGIVTAADAVKLLNYLAGNLATLYVGGDPYETDAIVGNLMYVPSGTFVQSSPVGEPCRDANMEAQFTHTLTRDIAVMATEVTRGMWAALRALQPTLPVDPTNTSYGAGANNPVQNVSWYETVLFANLLSAAQGRTRCYYTDAAFTAPVDATNYTTGPFFCDWNADGFRLLSEGEWEYSCRAGTTTPFWIVEPNYTAANCNSWTETPATWPQLHSAIWFYINQYDPAGNGKTKPVGLKAANPWGLHDIHGNVLECCWDWMGDYPTGSVTDYTGLASSTTRSVRSHSWFSNAGHNRSAYRNYCTPHGRGVDRGFRLARTL